MDKIKRVLKELPGDVRDNGEEILHAIACGTSLLDWDHNLRLVVAGRVIHNTNIIELVEHLLYPEREDGDNPHGFDMFVNELSHIGLDSQWVKNEYAKKILDDNERMYDTASSNPNSSESDESDNESSNESDHNSNEQSEHESNHELAHDEDQELEQKQPINWTVFSSDEESEQE